MSNLTIFKFLFTNKNALKKMKNLKQKPLTYKITATQ